MFLFFHRIFAEYVGKLPEALGSTSTVAVAEPKPALTDIAESNELPANNQGELLSRSQHFFLFFFFLYTALLIALENQLHAIELTSVLLLYFHSSISILIRPHLIFLIFLYKQWLQLRALPWMAAVALPLLWCVALSRCPRLMIVNRCVAFHIYAPLTMKQITQHRTHPRHR